MDTSWQTKASGGRLRTVPKGVMHIPVTPFKGDMAVNYGTFEKLVDWHVKQAPSSLCVILHIAESVSLACVTSLRRFRRCRVGSAPRGRCF